MRLLRRIASEVLGEDLARKVWGRVEIIGDIAVIRKPPDINLDVLKPLAEELLNRIKYVKSVWVAVTPVAGEYRIRQYVHLAGERRSVTLYKEHGCVFKIDITKVYVSPVLNYEHGRVAKDVRPGEYVINMFAGAGLFSIIMAKLSKPRKVVSIDINPDAYELMVENVRLNKVENIVEPVLGDACELVKGMEGIADRVLMPLPKLSLECLPQAVRSLKNSGVIHVYEFTTARSKAEAIDNVKREFSRKLDELGVPWSFKFARVVRSVGPRYYQVVLDILISRPAGASSAPSHASSCPPRG